MVSISVDYSSALGSNGTSIGNLQSLAELVKADETALAFINRTRNNRILYTGISTLDKRKPSHDGADVIEISGLSNTGKTQLLMHIVASCVLPQDMGGEESVCIYFDNEMKFDPGRMQSIITEQIVNIVDGGGGLRFFHGQTGTGNDIEKTITECTDRVKVVRCRSNLEVLYTLYSLRPAIESENIRLICMDTVASFFWETLDTDSNASGLHVSIPNALKRLMQYNQLCVAVTKPVLFNFTSSAPMLNKKRTEYLSETWRNMVSTRVFLSRAREQNVSISPSVFQASINSPSVNLSFEFEVEDAGVKELA
uniref:Rad51-like C-terminal domain-containing protein n=1 Tax=Aplanochytrium stocchinoi TaxID=215587 RepID=A0A7S3PDZ0_9STRA